jgi:HK97 family phage prohead protease
VSSLTEDVTLQTPGFWNPALDALINVDGAINVLEKQFGRTTLEDIESALAEYKRLYRAGIASPGEIITLNRAFPNEKRYQDAAAKLEDTPLVVGGPASVEMIDREGHLITTEALTSAFDNYMANFRTRNAMVLHSDVQVGWALPAYISSNGAVFRSGVDEKGLFFITEVRSDTKIAQKVIEKIHDGSLKSYSIAGSATKTKSMQKGLMPYMQVDEMELAEVTLCEKGVNQQAGFDLLKADHPAGTCIDGSCLIHLADKPADDCGCPTDVAKGEDAMMYLFKDNGSVALTKTFQEWMLVNSSLHNFGGRLAQHRALTQEYGFPSEEIDVETRRYLPVNEITVDDFNHIVKRFKLWVVNEAGQELGEYHSEDKLPGAPFEYSWVTTNAVKDGPAKANAPGTVTKSLDRLQDWMRTQP